MVNTLLASVAAAGLLLSAPAFAAVISFQGNFSGSQQVPPNGSPAIGTASLVADTVAQTLTVTESFSGLTSPSAAGHIHAGAPGVNGPVIIPFSTFPTGVTSGTFSGVFTAADLINQGTSGISTFGSLLTTLQAGGAYLNIHSSTLPNGEIRAAVVAASVPEPVALSIMGAALAGLGLVRGGRSRSARTAR